MQEGIVAIKKVWTEDVVDSTAIHALALADIEVNGERIEALVVAYHSKPREIYCYRLTVPSSQVEKAIESAIYKGESIGRLVSQLKKTHTAAPDEDYIYSEYLELGDASSHLSQLFYELGGSKTHSHASAMRDDRHNAVSRWLSTLQEAGGSPTSITI